MFDLGKPFLLCVDDDSDILIQLNRFLEDKYNIATATTGGEALQVLDRIKPSIILLDVMMPEMDGYELCSRLQENPETAWIPVVFISALGEEQDRARAFAAGAVDYLVKPVNRQTVRELVDRHQHTGQRWKKTKEIYARQPRAKKDLSGSIQEFICEQLNLTGELCRKMQTAPDKDIYSVAAENGLEDIQIAQAVATYKDVPFIEFIDPNSIQLGALPAPFSKANNVVVIHWQGTDTLVLSDPFDMMLQDSLSAVLDQPLLDNIAITDPGNIGMLFEKEPAPYIADRVMTLAVLKGASGIRIEAGESRFTIEIEIGGEFSQLAVLKWETGFKLLSRYKVLAGIAAADKNKVHDGVYTHTVAGKSCYVRLLLTNTPSGGSLTLRILDIY